MLTSTHAKLLPGLLSALALSGAAQAGGPYVIHTVSPCRVVDTRFAVAGPFPGSGQRLAAAWPCGSRLAHYADLRRNHLADS